MTGKTSLTRRRLWWLGVVLLGLSVALVAGWAGAFSKEKPSAEGAARTVPWLEEGLIYYPQSFAEREGLAVTVAEAGLVTPTVEVTGVIVTDARRVAAIGGRIEGRLRAVRKVAGDDVEAGEVVAELESAELGRAQAEVLKTRAREQVARLDAERERTLADAHVSSERDAQHAKATADALAAERVAAERAVEALGGTMGTEVGVLRLRSPLRGRIIEANARTGQTVESKDTLFTVADLSRVWVELSVFERDLPAVREGDEVELRLPSDSTRAYRGAIAHIAETIDSRRRAATVRVELPNPGPLRPGLSVTATIHASGPRQTYLKVPREAVTRIDALPTVFVVRGERRVEPREVTLGAEDSESVAIVAGLTAGEAVVTRGVLALKAEVFR